MPSFADSWNYRSARERAESRNICSWFWFASSLRWRRAAMHKCVMFSSPACSVPWVQRMTRVCPLPPRCSGVCPCQSSGTAYLKGAGGAANGNSRHLGALHFACQIYILVLCVRSCFTPWASSKLDSFVRHIDVGVGSCNRITSFS